jgi:hypothetical protein
LEKRDAEFAELVRKATLALAEDIEIEQAYEANSASVDFRDSFGDQIVWGLFSDAEESAFIVRRIHWHKAFDIQRFRDPMMGIKYGFHTDPTLTIQMASLDVDEISALLKEARDMVDVNFNKALPMSSVNLDGRRWWVFVTDAFGWKAHMWTTDEPLIPEISNWTERLVQTIDRQLKALDTENKPY